MQQVKSKILHRLKISKGHLNKVISMIDNDEYCIDIVHQLLAVQSSLKKIDSIILENHLKTCVLESIKKGESKKVIDEVMKVIEKK
jgi:DNA-binding FrmR family transcriptional regulator